MQKFIIKKTESGQAQGSGSDVRLSGYLKKKRIKVGGWKKLWFVLQNRLLLSYNSKEDYEERLAPFKDVISLVPGTQILPMHQNRFTIETTGKVFYIFRCDDPKTCSEWITALVESLNGHAGPEVITCPNFHIPKPMFCDASKSSSGSGLVITRKLGDMQPITGQQLDSLSFYGGNADKKGPNRQIARLPIAPITAKILQRGSFHEDEVEETKVDVNGENTIQNFRLHDESTSKQAENQSIDVSRINSMFHECSTRTGTVVSKQPTTTTTLNGGDCVENTINFKRLIKCEIVQKCTTGQVTDSNYAKDNDKRVAVTIKLEQNPRSENNNIVVNHSNEYYEKGNQTEILKDLKSNTNNKSRFLSQIANGKSVFDNMKKFIVKRSAAAARKSPDLNRNLTNNGPSLDSNTNVKANTDVVDYCNIEEQIQNMTLEDEDYEDENDNSSEQSTKESLCYLSVSPYQIKRNSYQNITEIEIPPPKSSPTISHHSPKNSLREIGTNLSDIEVPRAGEPVVYATINLEDKHTRRALRSTESPEVKDTKESTPPPQMTSDYEEVGMYIENDGSEDETIYEPVDINPKSNSHAAALWHNLKRINVDTLWLDLTRKMRERPDMDETGSPHTFTTFRDFKRKLGDHRRSLKARMQKMYHRNDKDGNGDGSSDCSSSHSHTSNNGNGIPLPGLTNAKLFAVNGNVIKDLKKNSHKSNGIGHNVASRASKLKARITFGSLGRVKKSRTSMFFEEFVPAKKITQTQDVQQQKTDDFKRELMSVVCETRKDQEQITDRCHNVGHESI